MSILDSLTLSRHVKFSKATDKKTVMSKLIMILKRYKRNLKNIWKFKRKKYIKCGTNRKHEQNDTCFITINVSGASS